VKIAGIVGGIAPGSTVEYYRQFIALCRERVQDGSYPPVIINSIDLKKMLDLIGASQLAEVTAYLAREVERLARAGAEVGLLASNTPHIVFDNLQRQSPIPLISIVEATCAEAKGQGLKRLGLFGTRFTMQGQFFPDVFTREGLALVTPAPDEQVYIHDKYMNELVPGIFRDETRDRLVAIADRMKKQESIQAVILAGTELPLILPEGTVGGVPLLDTTKIHVKALVARVLT
jgi:aspartate racemase